MTQSKFILIVATLWVICLLLSGCAKTASPITAINEGIQQSVAEIVNYADTNMVMDADKQLLLQGIKDCGARADAMTKTYEMSMVACQTKQSKLKTERNSLVIIVLLLLLFIVRTSVKSIAKKFFGL